MFDLYDMLFEVSNDVRHKIMMNLKYSPSTVTSISQKLSISLTEASRHFNRLSQVDLIQKKPNGDYILTLMGKTILSQIEPLSFVVNHNQYFQDHDATRIPTQFLNRIHELSDANANYTTRANIMHVVEKIRSVPVEAEKFSYCILDQSSMELVLYSEPDDENRNTESIVENISSGLESRSLFPSSLDKSRIPSESLKAFYDLHRHYNFEFRIIDSVDLFLYMNEKYSIISFPDKTNRFDYLGFEATDQKTLTWCKDVFDYYWGKSQPFLTY